MMLYKSRIMCHEIFRIGASIDFELIVKLMLRHCIVFFVAIDCWRFFSACLVENLHTFADLFRRSSRCVATLLDKVKDILYLTEAFEEETDLLLSQALHLELCLAQF